MPLGLGPAGWFLYPGFNPYIGNPYWRYGYPGYGYPMSKEQEKAMLEQEAKVLEDQLTQIRKRLEELGEK